MIVTLINIFITWLNKHVNFWQIFIIGVIINIIRMYCYDFDIGLITQLSGELPVIAVFYFLIPYSVFIFEMAHRSYAQRELKIRNFNKLLLAPSILLSGLLLPLLLLSNSISWMEILDISTAMIMLPTCLFIMDYANQKESQTYTYSYKNTSSICCH